jgi:hypothetical protein
MSVRGSGARLVMQWAHEREAGTGQESLSHYLFGLCSRDASTTAVGPPIGVVAAVVPLGLFFLARCCSPLLSAPPDGA